jgi:hypothetical protein
MSKRRDGTFSRCEFRFDPKRNGYICPAGDPLLHIRAPLPCNATAGSDPRPQPLAAVSRDTLFEIKARVRNVEAERDEFVAAENKDRLGLTLHDEVRLQYLL